MYALCVSCPALRQEDVALIFWRTSKHVGGPQLPTKGFPIQFDAHVSENRGPRAGSRMFAVFGSGWVKSVPGKARCLSSAQEMYGRGGEGIFLGNTSSMRGLPCSPRTQEQALTQLVCHASLNHAALRPMDICVWHVCVCVSISACLAARQKVCFHAAATQVSLKRPHLSCFWTRVGVVRYGSPPRH